MAQYELLPDGNYKIPDGDIKKIMADINAGKGLPPIGDNAGRSNKKIMADINVGKGIPPIPDDTKTPDDYYDDGSYSCITAMEKCFGKDAVKDFCCGAVE